jgi:hypothetical protein
MSGSRWTVRNVDRDALELLFQVRAACNWSTGDLLSEALRQWYRTLPELDQSDQLDEEFQPEAI